MNKKYGKINDECDYTKKSYYYFNNGRFITYKHLFEKRSMFGRKIVVTSMENLKFTEDLQLNIPIPFKQPSYRKKS